MVTCAAPGCKNKKNTHDGISFHQFPSDVYRRQQWVLAMRRADWWPNTASRLCSVHFEEHFIDRTSSILTLLKKNAIPTIFEGHRPIKNLEFLKPRPLYVPIKQEPFEDILNNNNRILVVPEGLNVQATFSNSNGYSSDKKNIVVIKDEDDLKTFLNCGDEDIDVNDDDNRTIIVSDGTNIKTEWCGIEDEYSEELPPYDPNYGEESCTLEIVNHSKLRALLMYDPDFYVRKMKKLQEKMIKLQKKVKLMHQTSRRRKRKITRLQKLVTKVKQFRFPDRHTTRPIVHVLSQSETAENFIN